jgi:peptidoglycan/LPS O-acetylase OafA/YrhL
VSEAATSPSRPAERAPAALVGLAVALGLVALGLPWGTVGSPGYTQDARVPVIAAGVALLLGWRRGSRPWMRLATVLGIVGFAVSGQGGGGPVVLLLALASVEVVIHRTTSARSTVP